MILLFPLNSVFSTNFSIIIIIIIIMREYYLIYVFLTNISYKYLYFVISPILLSLWLLQPNENFYLLGEILSVPASNHYGIWEHILQLKIPLIFKDVQIWVFFCSKINKARKVFTLYSKSNGLTMK